MPHQPISLLGPCVVWCAVPHTSRTSSSLTAHTSSAPGTCVMWNNHLHKLTHTLLSLLGYMEAVSLKKPICMQPSKKGVIIVATPLIRHYAASRLLALLMAQGLT